MAGGFGEKFILKEEKKQKKKIGGTPLRVSPLPPSNVQTS